MDKKKAKDEWEEIFSLPKSIIRTMRIFAWKYVPGATLIIIPAVMTLFVAFLQFTSALFASILIAWLASGIFKVRNRRKLSRGEEPGVQFSQYIYTFVSNAQWFLSLKGIAGIMSIIAGTFVAGSWAFLAFIFFSGSFPSLDSIEVTNSEILLFNFIMIASIMPSAAYQIYYWYTIIRRYPHFIEAWKQRKNGPINTLLLPRGGYLAFLLSCFFPLTFLIRSFFSDDFFTIDYIMYLLIPLWVSSAILFAFLIKSSIRENTQVTSASDLRRDNLRIPLSMLTANFGIMILLILMEMKSIIVMLIGLIVTICIAYYISDWHRYLDSKMDKSLVKTTLETLPYTLVALPFLIMIFSDVGTIARYLGYFMVIGVGFIAPLFIVMEDMLRRRASRKNRIMREERVNE